MKYCRSCEQNLHDDNFYPVKKGSTKLRNVCKKCFSHRHFKKSYGLNPDEVMDLISRPCDACGSTTERMVVDHCHTTGKVRGALCNGCNTALGLLKEDPLRITNLARYILRTGQC